MDDLEAESRRRLQQLLKMWMHYASQNWTDAEDLQSAVKRLMNELDCVAIDCLHASNYDMNYCFSEEKIKQLEEDYEKHRRGASLCSNYLSETINLDNFCVKMVEIGLKQFVISILLDYLPYATVVKYKLAAQENNAGNEDDIL
ncbi:uncharacterized protein LOC111692511 [Anoplophora glabripennis]|uniref:uncharacterized protein LOC111692511 n=1 Tax=Anoplophora glabripennis TaxID=217634 RepID=UPI000C765D96|nr:uncharacterized protein LOC111692511 [Anoplophora glabripennis]